METLSWLYLTDSTIPYLAGLLLSLTSMTILLHRAHGAPAPRLLAGFFGGVAGFQLVYILLVGTYLPVLAAFQLPPLQLAMVCLLQFTYQLPAPTPAEIPIARRILYCSLLAFVLCLILVGVEVLFNYGSPPFYFFYSLCLGLVALEFCLCIVIMGGRTWHFSRNSSGPAPSLWRALISPLTIQTQTTRAFALAFASPMLVALWAVLYQLFLRPMGLSLGTYLTLLGLSMICAEFIVVLVYLNYAPEATSFMDKLVLSTLTVVLSVLAVLGQLTLIPFQEKLTADMERWSAQVQQALIEGALDGGRLPAETFLVVSRPLSTAREGSDYRLDFVQQPGVDLAATMRIGSPYGWSGLFSTSAGVEFRYIIRPAFTWDGRQYYLGFFTAPYRIPANQRGLPAVLLMVFSTLVIVGLGPIFFRINLVQPLEQLLMGVRQVEVGELDVGVQPRYNDEIGHLTRAFNMMVAAIRDSAQALQQLNAELEQRVADRTAELAAANGQLQQHAAALEISHAEIQHLNQRLQAENLRMEAELDVARRIQTMLLPSSDELAQITGLKIAAFMQPADEVGGDYYDVLRHNGRVKIGIGDVTGHGLESGVVMLMLQTAIRTLEIHQENDPVRFLNTLNQLLYANLKRMHVPRSLSLSLLDYHQDSRHLCLSGQHEQLLLLRQGQVEQLDTRDWGFPLGLVTEISSLVQAHPLTLNSGDTVVLYSDGIPEAQNAHGDFYGLERLCTTLTAQAGRPPEVIKDAVIADIQAFLGAASPNDDLTLLILQQQ